MKSIWKGSLSFGLVNIQVQLYSAVQEHAVGFTLLCKKCHEPITYERWCKHCNKEVAWSDIVKGLKQENGSYFIITQEALKALKPHTTDTIDIVEFVPSSEIKTIYLEHHYYLLPEESAQKSFFLFKKALEISKKVAIGKFVMRDKQYICVINPYETALLLTTLNYAYEVRPLDDVASAKQAHKKVNAAELKLATELIKQRTVKRLNLNNFHDVFIQQLKAAIKKSKKSKAKPVKAKKEKVLSKKHKSEGSLMAHLRASLIAPGREGTIAHARSKHAIKGKK
jgi:DNA end-binding protein Ku